MTTTIIDAKILHGLSKGVDLEPLIIQEDTDTSLATPVQRHRATSDLPTHENTQEHHDNLCDVSSYLLKNYKNIGLQSLSCFEEKKSINVSFWCH